MGEQRSENGKWLWIQGGTGQVTRETADEDGQDGQGFHECFGGRIRLFGDS